MRWWMLLGLVSAIACDRTASSAANDDDSTVSGDGVVSGDDASTTTPVGQDAGSDAAPDTEADAGKDSSHGSGGIDCTSTQKVSGRTVCVASVGAVELKLVLPADFESNPAPLTLAVYVHGDGAGAHTSNSAAKSLLPWIDAHHAAYVSLLAPNRCSWWVEPSYTTCDETDTQQAAHEDTDQLNAPQFAAALAQLRGAYDVTGGPLFYYGSSGGSIFLAASFLPRYGNVYPGAFALNCGGDKPWGEFAWDPSSASQRGSTKLYFTYGAADQLILPELAEVPGAFSALGFAVDDHLTPNQTRHCSFEIDNHARAVQVWDTYLAE